MVNCDMSGNTLSTQIIASIKKQFLVKTPLLSYCLAVLVVGSLKKYQINHLSILSPYSIFVSKDTKKIWNDRFLNENCLHYLVCLNT